MTNPYYDAGEQRGAKVGDLFAAIAPRYDRINDLQSFGLHRSWKRRLVHMAEPKPGDRALDVCCGTGDIAFALAQNGLEVEGLDFSEAMLGIARERGKGRRPKAEGSNENLLTAAATKGANTPQSALRSPHFCRGDAQELPFADEQFDIVTVGYGLRNLASWETGLREMWRVARPGGRLLVLEFGKPPNRIWRELYFAYLRSCVPVLGKLFCGNAPAYRYILESLNHYPAQDGVAQLMRELACTDVRIIYLLGGVMTINFGRKSNSLPSESLSQ